MKPPQFIGIRQAKYVLSQMGIELSDRQMKRAAEKDANGNRKLPFFIDPIDGRLKIEKGDLVKAYTKLRVEAHKNLRCPDLSDSFRNT
ncbi:hypothetical protein [Salinarimonas rosea]|uniref:hypothetical protein n=1 Tax=Salinarimonas rosea TaxID=552063 RepID=UPI000A06A303|nr:hypothetical protein [Salinarimonas rosea]